MIEIRFPTERAPVTKRGILEKIASVYDPLGVVSNDADRQAALSSSV